MNIYKNLSVKFADEGFLLPKQRRHSHTPFMPKMPFAISRQKRINQHLVSGYKNKRIF